MAVAGTTSLTTLIRTLVDPELCKSVFQNTNFLKYFRSIPGPSKGAHPGAYVRIDALVAQNTGVAAAAEADGYQAVGAAAYQQGYFPFTTIYGTFGYYDEAKRALGVGLQASYIGADTEAEDTLGAVRDLMETTTMADATTGLLGMVDDDTTAWGSVNRGVYTTLQSLVTAGGSAVLTDAMLANTRYNMGKANYGATPELIMSEQTQANSYHQNVVASPTLTSPAVGDAGYAELSYAMIPWAVVTDFVNSEIAFLSGVRDGSGIAIYDHNVWDTAIFRDSDVVDFMPLQIGPAATVTLSLAKIAKTAPSSSYAWGLSMALVVRKPMKQAKIEALATSW